MARRQDGKTASTGKGGVGRVLRSGRESGARQGIAPNVVEIRPEPSREERAALLIALEHFLEARKNDASPPSAWALTGRRESHLARSGGAQAGWGRGLARLPEW